MLSKKEIEMIQNTNFKLPKERSRQEYNAKILSILGDLIVAFPEQRFGQILCNYVFPDYMKKDPFFEESKETFEKLSQLGKN